MSSPDHVLYVGAILPKASETFVYREVLGLRRRGTQVSVASVRPPELGLGDPALEALAHEAYVVYEPGMLPRAALGALHAPGVLLRGVLDAALGADLTPAQRPKLLWQCLGGLALAEHVRPLEIEPVHAHMAHTPTSVAMYAAQALGVPFSFTGHAADLFRDRSFLPAKLARAAFVASISGWHQRFYQAVAALRPDQAPVVRCGVDVSAFSPGVGGAGILAVGRFVPKKGFDLLIEAVAGLPNEVRPAVTIVGDGPEHARCQELVRQRGLAEWVSLPGAKTNDEVRALMRQAALFALPCRVSTDGDRDGIPVVLMEAMASGVPVISGDLPSIRELIEHDVSGLLVPAGDLDALTAALARVLGDDDLRGRLADGGRQRVLEEFAQGPNLDRLQRAFGGQTPRAISATASSSGEAPRPGRRYCLICPARDEAEFARRTLDALVEQTERPALLVVVDDGSTDETPAILADYAAKHPWIRVVTRADRGARKVGPGVIDAFYAGYESIDPAEFDYVCKIDLDLDLPRRYFELLMDRMEANPRLGTASGKPYFPGPSNTAKSFQGELISEACGDENSVGMIKFYRRQCFEEVGGFVREVMWDGIDCHRCRMLGWRATSWDDPELRFLHLRPMGSSHKGILTGRMRHGFGQWFMGTGPAYMTASALYRMTRPPYLAGGLGMWLGYVKSMLSGKPRYDDAQFRSHLRSFQWTSLLLGKRRATELADQAHALDWVQAHG
jgi:glycosyltransferase involved in cell wall biosynthesis